MPVPSSLALTNIADGSSAVAADHRNNFTAIQTAVNAIIGFLAAGSTGALLRYDGSNWAKTANVLVDDTNSKITFGALADTWIQRNSATLLDVYRSLQIRATAAANTILLGYTEGDAGNRFSMAADGTLRWAPASGVVDSALFRAGAGNLQSTVNFQAAYWLGTGPVTVAHSLPGVALGSTVGVTGATTADHGFLFWDGTNLKFRKPSNGTTTILV